MDWSFLAQAVWSQLAAMVRRTKTLPQNVHKHTSRGRILDALRRDPGKNLARICDELGMVRGTASYHLYVLERVGAIGSVSTGHTHLYFPPGAPAELRSGLAVLRRERALEVVRAIVRQPGIAQHRLLATIGMSRKVWRQYVREFTRERLLNEERRGGKCHYSPTPRLQELLPFVDVADEPDRKPNPSPPGRRLGG